MSLTAKQKRIMFGTKDSGERWFHCTVLKTGDWGDVSEGQSLKLRVKDITAMYQDGDGFICIIHSDTEDSVVRVKYNPIKNPQEFKDKLIKKPI